MQDFLEFVKVWFWKFNELFQKLYHYLKDDLGLIPEEETTAEG